MTKYSAKQLLERYIEGTCSAEEKAIVESWHLKELERKNFEPDPNQLEQAHENIWRSINSRSKDNFPRPILKRLPYRYAAAVIVTIALSAALFFFIQKNTGYATVKELLVKSGKDFIPGGNKAILTLADGSKISLTDAATGKLINQSGISITKTKDGQVIYKIDSKEAADVKLKQPIYNTITTPKGGQFQIDLPDGSKIWLNAESSLKYPMVFKGDIRKVELTGEAYFEVAKAGQPFIVASNGQEVEVLGTHFNINSYADEGNTKTTLLEGSVSVAGLGSPQIVNRNSNIVILQPNQQAILNTNNIIKVQEADIENAMAWKNNLFIFKGESIESITRKLSRWYDVEFSFEGNASNLSYVGIVSRSKNISSVLSIMEGAGNVHFKIDGRRITIITK
ncbi:FecR family protein [Pedobacter frigoris]|uniref:FecR family protein n=1 Tax=Pedobacter frigoris TaxID=2571272 RepID=A0A4U1CCF6_9SPHI|nr:FecR family protein [Pedobacter frigoris]TKC03658.1 FecR family protein [Pedobacter frigoris]